MHGFADLKHAFGCHRTNLTIGGQSGHHPIVAEQILLSNVALQVDV